MTKAYFFSALLPLLCGLAHSQTPANSASADGKLSTSTQPLSPAQKAVWAAEERMHRYEQQKDEKRFLSLWDDNFIGWPDYQQRPVRKPAIEEVAVEDFQQPKSSGPTPPAPKPEAIGIFGDIAVTHYFSPEADQTSPTVFRITHTWKKGPQGWQIISGMSCEVPRTDPTKIMSAESSAPSPGGEEKAVEATVRGYEQAVQEYDFFKADSFLAPNAKWIEEDSYPEAADHFDEWWQEAKKVKLHLENHPHDFDIRIQGDVAWVIVFVDASTVVDNEAARAFTLRDHPNERAWVGHFVESEVLVKTPKGWEIAMAHTSRLRTN